MKSNLTLVLIIFFGYVIGQNTINTNPINVTDSIQTDNSTKKTGFGIGGTPILAYDADLGLKYGVIINLFDYGTIFPNYKHFAKIKLLNSTNGTSHFSLIYDNNTLIKKGNLIFESTYIKDILLNFYGFNGEMSKYNENIKNMNHNEYLNPYYYSHERGLFKLRLDFNKQIFDSKLTFISGASYHNYSIGKTNLDKFNLMESNMNNTLFEKYIEEGIISDSEKDGGQLFQLKLGLGIDTRDNKINCNSGVLFESYFLATTTSHNTNLFKNITTFKHYIFIPKVNTLLTYRLTSQQKIYGKNPFYYLPTYHDSNGDVDGLGGTYNLRGIYRNRIVADGFISGNIELRKSIIKFESFKQQCDIVLSVFSDFSYITQNYFPQSTKLTSSEFPTLFTNQQQRINYTYGAGFYFIYNTNNIISVNYGMSPNKNLGTAGLYIGASFLF